MGRSGRVLTSFLEIRTKNPNNKQKARFAITDITNQNFSKLFNKFKNSTYQCYKNKQVHNEPNHSYLFLIKHISELIKRKTHVQLRNKGVKSDANEKTCQQNIVRVNETIQYIITLMNWKKLVSINITIT